MALIPLISQLLAQQRTTRGSAPSHSYTVYTDREISMHRVLGIRNRGISFSNMENLHQVQDSILAAYAFDIIDDIEFLLLSEINSSSNQDFEHDDGHFDLDNFNDDECWSYYR